MGHILPTNAGYRATTSIPPGRPPGGGGGLGVPVVRGGDDCSSARDAAATGRTRSERSGATNRFPVPPVPTKRRVLPGWAA